jgi:hypothetical protein
MATYQYWSSGDGVSASAGYISVDNMTITQAITFTTDFLALMRCKVFFAGNGVDSYLVQSAYVTQDTHSVAIKVNGATTFYIPAYGRWSDYSSIAGFTVPGTADFVTVVKLKVPMLIPITGGGGTGTVDTTQTGLSAPGVVTVIDQGVEAITYETDIYNILFGSKDLATGGYGKTLKCNGSLYATNLDNGWHTAVYKSLNGLTWDYETVYPLHETVDTFGPINQMGFTAYGTKIYMGGGSNDHSSEFPLNWYSYDVVTKVWAALLDMPVPMSAFFCEVINGKIYVGMGFNAFTDGTTYTYDSSCYVYDIAGNTWSSMLSWPGDLTTNPQSWVLEGEVYVGYGYKYILSNYVYYPKVYKYTPLSGSWSYLGCLSSTYGRIYESIVGQVDGVDAFFASMFNGVDIDYLMLLNGSWYDIDITGSVNRIISPVDITSVTSTETITVTDNTLIQAGDTITITGVSA